ncbi:MAG: hypothetical protein QGG39_18300, partial [Candidatus Poribacteria bacterium]|nr:hypothetical protein [Candidatus Poribacteria bacterium]
RRHPGGDQTGSFSRFHLSSVSNMSIKLQGQAEGRRTDQGVDGRRWAFKGHRLWLPEPGG